MTHKSKETSLKNRYISLLQTCKGYASAGHYDEASRMQIKAEEVLEVAFCLGGAQLRRKLLQAEKEKFNS